MARILALFSVIASVAGLLPAEQAQLSGPIEGFTFDAPTGSFRAVIGLPGSALLGPAILDGFVRGSVAPQKDYGVAFTDGKCAIVSGLSPLNTPEQALSGCAAGVEDVVWSGDGSRAIFFSRSGSWIQTIAGLPNAAASRASVDLSYLGGSISTVAADIQGKRVAIGMAGDPGGVYLITTEDGDPVPLLGSSKPIALAFSSDGDALYALDGATLRMTEWTLADLTSKSFPLDGLRDPIAIKSTRDATNRRVLYVAGRNDYLLRAYDASSHEVLAEIPLDFLPSEISDFGRSSFLLAPRLSNNGPLWLFASAPQQAVFFVPVAPAASGGPQ
jgi:hypothetical protein